MALGPAFAAPRGFARSMQPSIITRVVANRAQPRLTPMTDLAFPAERPLALTAIGAASQELHDIVANPDVTVAGVAPVQAAMPGHLSFFSGKPTAAGILERVPGGAVVVASFDPREHVTMAPDVALIVAPRPRRWFIQAVRQMFPAAERPFSGVSPHACVDPAAEIGVGTAIGPFAVVDAGARLGRDCLVFPGVHIGRDVILGDEVIVQSNSVLGGIGQANEKDTEGQFVSLPHLAGVRIGNRSRIGCNSSVLRGSLQHTTIGEGCLIGNHVNVGHNVTVGNDTFISAGAILCGSSRIGNGCWISPGATILNKLRIGDGAMVGLGAIVSKPVPADGYVAMEGAKPYRKLNKYNK